MASNPQPTGLAEIAAFLRSQSVGAEPRSKFNRLLRWADALDAAERTLRECAGMIARRDEEIERQGEHIEALARERQQQADALTRVRAEITAACDTAMRLNLPAFELAARVRAALRDAERGEG